MGVTQLTTMQACTPLGLTTAEGKMSDLQKLEDMLMKNIVEVEAAKNNQILAAKALLGLKLVKATCGAFIALAVEATDLIGMGGKGKMVGAAYGGASSLADSVGKATAGMDAGWGNTAANVVVAGVGVVAGKAKASSDVTKNFSAARKAGNMLANPRIDALGAKRALDSDNISAMANMVKRGKFKGDMIVAAINDDKAGLKKSASDYGKSVGLMTANAANKNLGKLGTLATEMVAYNDELQKVFDEAIEDQDTGSMDGTKRTLIKQLSRIRGMIRRYEDQLGECMLDIRLT